MSPGPVPVTVVTTWFCRFAFNDREAGPHQT